MHFHRAWFPAVSIAVTLALAMGLLLLLHLLRQQDVVLHNRAFLGLDYDAFYKASEFLLEGASPYDSPRYVTPPLPALVNAPLTRLSFETAAFLISAATLLATLAGLAMASRALRPPSEKDYQAMAVSLAVAVFFSYPLYFLFDRGNIDGFVLWIMCGSLAAAANGKRGLLAGLLVACAVSSKIYPILLVIPLAVYRRWAVLAWAGAFQALFIAARPAYWMDFYRVAFVWRIDFYTHEENGSIVSAIRWAGQLAEFLAAKMGASLRFSESLDTAAYALYAFLLGMMAVADFKRKRSADKREFHACALFYFPFMVAIPKVSYHYELVVLLALIPCVCYLWPRSKDRWTTGALMLITLGIAVSQMQATALEKLTGNGAFYSIPGFGLLLAMVGCAGYRLRVYWLESELQRSRPGD